MGQDRHIGGGEALRGAVERGLVDGTQTERVADRDLARHAMGPAPLGDHAKLFGANLARIVEMDVDTDAAPFGDPEDGIELAGGIAVDAGRIDTADKIGALADRGIEQLDGPRRRQDAALGERDDLDGDGVAETLARRQDALEVVEARLGIDIDMGAKVGRALAQHPSYEVGRPLLNRQREVPADPLLGLDAIAQGRTGGMGHPGQSEERLVEMKMTVDQTGKDQSATGVQLAVLGDIEVRPDVGDDAAQHDDIDAVRRRMPSVPEHEVVANRHRAYPQRTVYDCNSRPPIPECPQEKTE